LLILKLSLSTFTLNAHASSVKQLAMLNTKIVQLLRVMPEREVKAFFKYAAGGIGKNSLMADLLALLKKHYPDELTDEYLSEAEVAKALREQRSKSVLPKSITEATSRLYSLLEDFLILEKLNPKSAAGMEKTNRQKRRDLLMLEIFQEKGAHHLFELKAAQAQQLVQQPEYLSIWSLFDQLYLNHLLYFSTNDTKKKETETGQERLILLTRLLDDFYEVAHTLYQSELKNRENVLDDPLPVDNHADLTEHDQTAAENRPLDLLRRGLNLAKGLNDAYTDGTKLDTLLAFYIEHGQKFSPDLQMILHGYCVNAMSHQGRYQDASMNTAIFEHWYHNEALNELLHHHNLLTSNRFMNTIATACVENKTDWAEAYLSQYGDKLPDTEQEVAIAIAKAMIAFYKGQYDRVHQLLSLRKAVPSRLEIRARTFQLLAFVEQNAGHDIIIDHCKNFQDYLSSHNDIGESTKLAFLNLLKVTKALVNNKNAKAVFEKLNGEPIVCQSWIKQKIY
jgi:hypothetical protein